MSTCFGCEIQTVYSCLNRTEITENRHKKLKPNQTEPKKIWTVAALKTGVRSYQQQALVDWLHNTYLFRFFFLSLIRWFHFWTCWISSRWITEENYVCGKVCNTINRDLKQKCLKGEMDLLQYIPSIITSRFTKTRLRGQDHRYRTVVSLYTSKDGGPAIPS